MRSLTGSLRRAPSSRCRFRFIRGAPNTRPFANPRKRFHRNSSTLIAFATRFGPEFHETWGQLTAARAQIEAAQAQVEAAQKALKGVLQEASAGQRTTIDVLNAQQELISARVTLVATQRDRVVTSYAVLAAVAAPRPRGSPPAG